MDWWLRKNSALPTATDIGMKKNPLKYLAIIRLLTDRYKKEHGVGQGEIGVTLDVYGDEAYEVEFSRDDGTTIAWFTVKQDEVEPL